MEPYFKNKYDVIIIGSGLAGMACALELKKKGVKDVLILEQHNLPGGLATSYLRHGIEMEATLHEMMSIGKNNCLSIGKFFRDMGIDISWIRVPEAYRYVDQDVNVLIHAGEDGDYFLPAKEIAEAVGEEKEDCYKKVLSFLDFCKKIYIAMSNPNLEKESPISLLKKYPEFVRTIGHSAKIVMDHFSLPEKAQRILSAYWIYLGNSVYDLPASIFCYLLADYLGYGSYIPQKCSHEMSLKMIEKCYELGVEAEFGMHVDEILLHDGKAVGVKVHGQEIYSDYVVSGAYPDKMYPAMKSLPLIKRKKISKMINSKVLGMSCFSLNLILDKSPEELHIQDYSTFYAPDGLDFDKINKDYHSQGHYSYVTSICMNKAKSDCIKEGYTLYSITALPYPDGWLDVTEENYSSMKEKNARYLLEMESERLGVNLFDHIVECIIESPITIAHYTGAYRGSVYGYQHSMDDHIIARRLLHGYDHFIQGLYFAGAHSDLGDGMGPAIANGRLAADDILHDRERKESKK